MMLVTSPMSTSPKPDDDAQGCTARRSGGSAIAFAPERTEAANFGSSA